MPKIMYRPNPVPPPFVPPEPSYDNEIIVKIDPFPAKFGDNCEICLENGKFPNFDAIAILGCDEPLVEDDILTEHKFTPSEMGNVVSIDINFDTDIYPYYMARFEKEGKIVYICNAILQAF